jgi:GntR family transcriptional regulator
VFDGAEPIYRQIAQQLRDDVVAGRLREEEQVMSTTQYASQFRINPATAARAFTDLTDEGVLYKRRGVGMFVAPGARERLVADRRERYLVEVLDPALREARVLGIPAATVVEHVRRQDWDEPGREGTR